MSGFDAKEAYEKLMTGRMDAKKLTAKQTQAVSQYMDELKKRKGKARKRLKKRIKEGRTYLKSEYYWI